jgi:hypothetical protein
MLALLTAITLTPLRWPEWSRWVLAALLTAAFFAPAFSRDLDGRYANSPNHDWISHLKNQNGMLCCEEAEGHRLEDVDWRGEADGTYSVRLNGEWVKISKEQIVTEPNRIGSAMVWVWQNQITCFIPGAGF